MPRKGRNFEKLVAGIEDTLGKKQAEVKSPEYIKGKSGVVHEIDVSIRGKLQNNSIDYLIIILCRERKKRENVIWIQEVLSKKIDIGAHQAIAVSSAGFTKGAKKFADEHGITLRLLSEFNTGDIYAKFISQSPLQFPVIKWFIDSTSYQIYDKKFRLLPTNEYDNINNILKNDWQSPIFLKISDRKRLSYYDLVMSLPKKFWENVEISLYIKKQKYEIKLTGEDFSNWYKIKTSLGFIDVNIINIDIVAWLEYVDAKPKTLYLYVDRKKELLMGTLVYNINEKEFSKTIYCNVDINSKKAYINGVEQEISD